jgi:phosphopantothenoylcysteine decarboxylase/phosphopantothenate--cysteine ligase
MAAAVGDYAPKESADYKLKETELTLSLIRTPDILSAFADSSTVRIGFSVETGEDWRAAAVEKLSSKRLDAIVANPAEAIGSEKTQAVIIYADGKRVEVPRTSKEELAERLVEVVADLLEKRKSRD